MKVIRSFAAAVLLVVFTVSPAVAADTIKIGALLAVTGPASFLGAPEAKTLEMLVNDINKKGGVRGRKIELISMDTGSSPEKAFSFAKQLIEEKKVLAIIGPSTSGETMKIKNVAEEGKTTLISCSAAEVIVKPVARYVFKVPQDDSDVAVKIFDQMNRMHITKIGLLSSNTGFGKAGKEQVEKLAPAHGITVAVNEVYDKSATDLTAEVTKLKAAGVQAVLNWSIEPAQSIVIKNARQIGLNVPFFQSHGFANIKYAEAAGPAAEGVMFPAGKLLVAETLPKNDKQKDVLVKYKRAYESKFNEDASTFGGHAYDALYLILNAVEKTGGTDKEAVRTAIENTKGFVGIGGIFNFTPADHNGLDISNVGMLTVKKGRFAILGK
ncbi:MAG TPA: ABC transporter substrate-binding protein [Nitrospirota bacterium]|jgi:branched-chain amino acid transport system substrate-binding protein